MLSSSNQKKNDNASKSENQSKYALITKLIKTHHIEILLIQTTRSDLEKIANGDAQRQTIMDKLELTPIQRAAFNSIIKQIDGTKTTSSSPGAVPSFPPIPSLPSIPSVPAIPSIPSLPHHPNLKPITTPTNNGAIPIIPTIPSIPAIPTIPALPNLSSIPAIPLLTDLLSATNNAGPSKSVPPPLLQLPDMTNRTQSCSLSPVTAVQTKCNKNDNKNNVKNNNHIDITMADQTINSITKSTAVINLPTKSAKNNNNDGNDENSNNGKIISRMNKTKCLVQDHLASIVEELGTKINGFNHLLQNLRKRKKMDPPFPSHLSWDELVEYEIGDTLDHRDNAGRYIKAEIMDIRRRKSNGKTKIEFFLHYINWNKKWDVWSSVNKEMRRYAEFMAISHRQQHRDGVLRVDGSQTGQLLEIKPWHLYWTNDKNEKYSEWHIGVIHQKDQHSCQLFVILYEKINGVWYRPSKNGKTVWIHIDNKHECAPLYTHLKKARIRNYGYDERPNHNKKSAKNAPSKKKQRRK